MTTLGLILLITAILQEYICWMTYKNWFDNEITYCKVNYPPTLRDEWVSRSNIMKNKRIEILQKVASGEVTPEQADEKLLI